MSRKYVTNFRGENFYTPDGKMQVKEEPVTPVEEDFGDHHHLDTSFEDYGMRKSMSMNDIASLREDAKQEFDKHEPFYRCKTQTNHPLEISKTKFVSMAEAIYHFQRDTPGRFHSSKPQIFRSKGPVPRSELTRPQSPVLRCKARSRPLHVMSLKEKEEMELEEIKKFKIKAHPIPKSILEGTIYLPEVPKKAITVPEPFNLTEFHKKLPGLPSPVQKFKARPAPKHILEKPQIPPKPPVEVTMAVSPKFHYKRAKSEDQLKNKPVSAQQKPVEKPQRHGPVKPEPFSFQKSDEERKKRKEEQIQKQIEEERKQASLFKAQSVPGAVKKRMHIMTLKSCSSTTSSENKENHFKFEAKPPVVLYKEPFKPILQPTHLKQVPFSLTTEKRAAEREKFEKQLKEKEEEMEKLRQQREREKQAAEERAQTELRMKLVHHAKPVPTFNQFVPEKSIAPLTVPETPKFVRRLKKN